MNISPYTQLALFTALGAPALAGWTSILISTPRRGAEIYAVILLGCLLVARSLLWTAVDSASFHATVTMSLVGVALAALLVTVEAKLRKARRSTGTVRLRTSLIVIAALEEVLYRGILLQLALFIPDELGRLAAIATMTFWFAAIHVETSFRWKLPLSCALTAIALVSGSAIPAIATHVAYNLMVVGRER